MNAPVASREPVSVRILVGRAATDLWRVLPQVLLFQLVFAVLGIGLLSPLLAWMFNRLAATTGNSAIGNLDIAWFLLTPIGGALGLAALSVACAVATADVAGVLTILWGAAFDRRITYYAALRFVALRFSKILAACLLVLCLLITAALPFIVAALLVARAKLGEFDINYYLEVQPPEFISAVRLGIILAVCATGTALLMAVPLVFVLPEVLFRSQPAWSAIKSSYRLAARSRTRIAVALIGWFAAWQIASLAVSAMAYWLAGAVISSIGVLGTQLAMLGFVIALALAINFGLTLLAVAMACALLARLYYDANPAGTSLPDKLADAQQLAARPQWTLGKRGPMYAVLVVAGIAMLLVRGVLVNANCEDRVGIIAHRGSSLSAPENTLKAFRLAIVEGATAVELDVQRTADGKIVVMHDADLKRVSASRLVVQQSTFEELRAVLVEEQEIPTLDEVIDLTKGRVRLLVELKSLGGDGTALVEGVVEVLQRREVLDQAEVMSFVYKETQAVKRLEPRLRVGFLASARIGDLTRLDVDFLAVSRGQATDALVAAAHARGRQVYVWTINDRRDMELLLDRGVNSIITKKPALLVEILKERAQLDPGERLLLRLKTLYLQ
jgi:glycerophosphoryl diester phosphodiesterase